METNTQQAPKTLEQVIEYCKFQRFDTEQVGSWIWVSFDEKPDESTLSCLKEYGFKYSPRRKKWAHNCGHPTRSAVNVNPWDKYDHAVISGKGAK